MKKYVIPIFYSHCKQKETPCKFVDVLCSVSVHVVPLPVAPFLHSHMPEKHFQYLCICEPLHNI